MNKHIYKRITQTLTHPNKHPHFHPIRPLCSTPQQSNQDPSNRVSEIVNELMNLTLLESADLTEVMRKKMGINQMPIMAVMMPGMGLKTGGGGAAAKGGAAAAAAVKEKTAFDLKLEGGFDSGSKIKIIKEVRTFTDLGLKEAKELVEKAPTLLKKGVAKEEAEKIIEKMKAIGAKVVME
ncbi:putative ribosomal protein L7/L12 [Helianthus debilis subsp. tardiflorus]